MIFIICSFSPGRTVVTGLDFFCFTFSQKTHKREVCHNGVEEPSNNEHFPVETDDNKKIVHLENGCRLYPGNGTQRLRHRKSNRSRGGRGRTKGPASPPGILRCRNDEGKPYRITLYPLFPGNKTIAKLYKYCVHNSDSYKPVEQGD